MGETEWKFRRFAAGLPSAPRWPGALRKACIRTGRDSRACSERRIPVWATRMDIAASFKELRWIIGKGRTVWPVGLKRMTAAPPVLQTHQERTAALAMQRAVFQRCCIMGRPFRRAYRSNGGAIAIALSTRTAEMLRSICATGLRICTPPALSIAPLELCFRSSLGTCLVVQAPSELMELEATQNRYPAA